MPSVWGSTTCIPPSRQGTVARTAAAEMTCARRANPLYGRIEPQRQQNCRIGRRASRFAFSRLDGRIKFRQVEALQEAPHNAGTMVRGQQRLQINIVPSRLRSIRPNDPRFAHVESPLQGASEPQPRAPDSGASSGRPILHTLDRGGGYGEAAKMAYLVPPGAGAIQGSEIAFSLVNTDG
jgi:hypothetical protein